MAKIADTVYSLIEPTVLSLGITLWDVRFVKEGASYYLRVYIDKPEGISIDDCVAVSHAVDPIIDKADPIDKQYYLEVCSPGVERELTRDWHYEAAAGQKVCVKLFSAVSGKKEFCGILNADKESISLTTEDGVIPFNRSDIAKAYIKYQD
ncbi:MAG: ribosome maturation factor RimP [Clostridia bacterium]|nr:ribosome maturation factor RimP [Clostridia bacterium]